MPSAVEECVCGVCACVRVVCVCHVRVCRKWRLERRAGAVEQREMRVGPDHSSPFRSKEELGILI